MSRESVLLREVKKNKMCYRYHIQAKDKMRMPEILQEMPWSRHYHLKAASIGGPEYKPLTRKESWQEQTIHSKSARRNWQRKRRKRKKGSASLKKRRLLPVKVKTFLSRKISGLEIIFSKSSLICFFCKQTISWRYSLIYLSSAYWTESRMGFRTSIQAIALNSFLKP